MYSNNDHEDFTIDKKPLEYPFNEYYSTCNSKAYNNVPAINQWELTNNNIAWK